LPISFDSPTTGCIAFAELHALTKPQYIITDLTKLNFTSQKPTEICLYLGIKGQTVRHPLAGIVGLPRPFRLRLPKSSTEHAASDTQTAYLDLGFAHPLEPFSIVHIIRYFHNIQLITQRIEPSISRGFAVRNATEIRRGNRMAVKESKLAQVAQRDLQK
jgi:hypothetical protein